ncbi:MAG: histone deacetylase family protein [Gammaproteobacteria bacterium]|nr:histone deacetylase family protein [Gammaproteobacteria bacterium]
MRTAYISHSDCLAHETGTGHPENARRLTAIQDRLVSAHLFDFLRHLDAPQATDQQLLRVHSADYLTRLQDLLPERGLANLDPDTKLSAQSLQAARRAAGAVVMAVDRILGGELQNAFCAVRPPGHHAERARGMGFCLCNNVAVGAAQAMEVHGLSRVAIIDFDVHQGNGTEQIFMDDRRVLFCSTFQHPFYPYTPLLDITDRMVSVPLAATAKSTAFRAAVTEHWLPALVRFKPEMLFVSAGFDAHEDDDMSGVSLTDADFQWVTEQLMRVADASASGRIVSVLEGGYELHSLARCVERHIRLLMGLH